MTDRASGGLIPHVQGSDVLPFYPADIDTDDLSSLIGEIYDAALRPDLWPTVLRSACRFLGGLSAALYAKDISGAVGGIYHDDGVLDRSCVQSYFERYTKLEPTAANHLYAEIDQPISTLDMLGHEEFGQSRFYREWAVPQGIVDFLSAPLEKRAGWAAMFGIFRHASQGMVDETMRRRMRLVVPHIRRAVLIGRVVEQGVAQAASFGEAFDGLSSALFLVDERGGVVHANVAGSAMLADGRAVRSRDGRLVALDRTAAAALSEVFLTAGSGDTAVGVRGISVVLPVEDGTHFVAHVLPLTSSGRQRTGVSYAAVAAVFIHRATLDTPTAPEVLARTFGLTPSELRVLVAIVQAGGVGETAAALGIAETTVKTHLGRVFAKTGTARQADLVKLVAGFRSPLVR